MSRLVLVLAVLGLAGAAHADEVDSRDGVVEGVAYDPAIGAVGGATVRIVGDEVVVVVRADRFGQFHVAGLAPGRYRVELERGRVEPIRRGVTISKAYLGCGGPPLPERTYAVIGVTAEVPAVAPPAPAPRPAVRPRALVDTSSTSLGIRLGRAELGRRR